MDLAHRIGSSKLISKKSQPNPTRRNLQNLDRVQTKAVRSELVSYTVFQKKTAPFLFLQ